MRKLILLLLAVTFFSSAIGCVCSWFISDEERKSLFDDSDIVFKGKIIEEIRKPNTESISRIGLLKVTKAYKGCEKNDTICVLQNYYSNCSNGLSEGISIIVFSDEMSREVQMSDSIKYCRIMEETLTFRSEDSAFVELINSKNDYKTVGSNQCTMFSTKDREMKKFLEQIK